MDNKLARFNVIIEINQSVNLSPEPTMPEEWKFKLENYGNFWWTVVNIRYERPQVIEVWNMYNETFIKAYSKDQNINLTDLALNPDNCGANIYDPNTSNIIFIINNNPNCVLKVRTIDAITIKMHLDTTVTDFYANNGVATFMDKISAFLGLDISRIRIASVQTVFANVSLDIVAEMPLSDFTSAVVTDIIFNFCENTNNFSNNTNNTTPKVIVQGSEDNTTMIVLLAVLVPCGTLVLLLLCLYIRNRSEFFLIKLAFDYSFNKKEVEVTFNQVNLSKEVAK